MLKLTFLVYAPHSMPFGFLHGKEIIFALEKESVKTPKDSFSVILKR